MRTLKPLQDFLTPDIYYRALVVTEVATGQSRHYTPPDLYALVEQTKLLPEVPECLSSHFATAQNLLAYSWFYQPFLTAAELCAYTSVERALRHSSGFPVDEDMTKLSREQSKERSFRTLYAKAIADGLLTDAGFPSFAGLPPLTTESGEPMPRVEKVKELMLEARNHLAHGGTRLSAVVHFDFVTIAAELINQLFQQGVRS